MNYLFRIKLFLDHICNKVSRNYYQNHSAQYPNYRYRKSYVDNLHVDMRQPYSRIIVGSWYMYSYNDDHSTVFTQTPLFVFFTITWESGLNIL